MPKLISETSAWMDFEYLSDLVKEAMEAGTFDARTDRHLTWSLLLLDRVGWGKLVDGLKTLRGFLLDEQQRAKVRMGNSGEQPLRMTIGMAAFESPKTEEREP